MSHDDGTSNDSNNRPFQDVLKEYTSRRDVLAGGLATAATTFFGASSAAEAHGRKHGSSWWDRRTHWRHAKRSAPLIGFEPVPLGDYDGLKTPLISSDYEYQVLIPWGSSLRPGGPDWGGNPLDRPTSAEALEQIGVGHDGMWFFPINERRGLGWWGRVRDRFPFWNDKDGWWGNAKDLRANTHGVLAINHEFGSNFAVFGKTGADIGATVDDPYLPQTLEEVRIAQHSIGCSIVEIRKKRGRWQPVDSYLSRRVHVNTPVLFSGPASRHALLQTPAGNEPAGTMNNCANGYTPWGTYLTCEENFNGYFGATSESWQPTGMQDRYGLTATGFDYGWHFHDPRFDLSSESYRNEENRFGWVVEIDPMNPWQPPIKRTALGRFKHEGVGLVVGKDGRVVCYMGDDEAGDYIYKFVSSHDWKWLRTWGLSPLDHGKLYVARFDAGSPTDLSGAGEWLELTISNPALAVEFDDQAEILIYARKAADLLLATKMDRPEWTSVAPNGDVYCTLTNNSGRTDPAPGNPIAEPSGGNADGHIIRWRDSHDHVGTTFEWDIFLIARDTHGNEDSFADPDGLWADPDGRVFIQTDGGQKDGLNNQMLVADAKTGEIRRLFMGVPSDEITGIAVTPDRRTMFINTQHPGNGDPSLTNFPADQDGVTIPRDCTFVITRKDGGIIGS